MEKILIKDREYTEDEIYNSIIIARLYDDMIIECRNASHGLTRNILNRILDEVKQKAIKKGCVKIHERKI